MAARTDPLPTRCFYVLAAVVFAVSLMKGLRMPNLWAATHMTFNYQQGFIRRALFGEVLLLVSGGRLYHYRALFVIAVLLFTAVVVVVARMIRRAVRLDDGDLAFKAAILAFAASPGIVFWAHMIGYLDYVGVLATSIFVLWSARSRRPHAIFPAAAAVGVALALIHESMVVMFMPPMLFAMICHTIVRTRDSETPRAARAASIGLAAAATAVTFAAAVLICLFGTRSAAAVDALRTSTAPLADFPLRRDAFETLYQPVSENLFHVIPAMFRFHPHHTSQVVHGLVVSCAGLAVMIGYGLRLIHRLGLTERERTAVNVGFVAAALVPLSLNFFGWDSARWNAICFFDAFFGIITLKLFFTARAPDPAAQRIDGPWGLTLAAIAVVFGLTSNYDLFLFDGYVVQWFPFDQRLKAFFWLLKDGFRLIPGA